MSLPGSRRNGMKRLLRVVYLGLFLLALTACPSKQTDEGATTTSSNDKGAPAPNAAAAPSAVQPTSAQPLTLTIVYGSEKKTWLEEQAKSFETTKPKVASGKVIKIDARAMGSGEALQAILGGEVKPHVFSPASGAYISLLNRSWLSQPGHTSPLSPAGEPVVLSPLVIATWKPMAEALGWPAKQLGWKDLIAVSKNPKGWAAHGHPEWGPFKLGHTHPELSNSGLLSVVAEAYAGAKKTRGLAVADLSSKPMRDFVAGVEKSIVHYGKSTGFFADKMLERGPAYLSAAVLYENLVIESYSKKTDAPFPVVAIYPVEGTFWSDHPYAVLDAPWVGADEREAAQQFLAFLKSKPQQERALALGFRPADTSIPMEAPIDAAHGVDAKQPQTLLEVPDVATLDGLLALWRENKKAADVALVFDKSGSMAGKPLAEAKLGAKAFLDSLGDRDQVTLLLFDSKLYPPIGPLPLGANRASLAKRIDDVIAGGGTALYEATQEAYSSAMGRAHAEPGTIHAVVVMTDGKDEDSKISIADLNKGLTVEGGGAPVKVFTIAYGQQAQFDILSKIADAAQGTSAKGSVENIVQVYRDMASFF
jgi:Ca-activated chloride channel family protein